MPRKDLIQNIKRLVIKIGTSSLTEEGEICNRKVSRFVRQVCDILDEGYQVVIVSSGAITAGAGRIGKKRESLTIPEKQALASVGQALLINEYRKYFSRRGYEVGQVLLTEDDLKHRRRFLNARHTMEALLEMKVVPIVNENDTVVVKEIKFGDNDTLSAYITSLISADLLILLSDVKGFYMNLDDPCPVDEIHRVTDDIYQCAGGTASGHGTGGMLTKIRAAELIIRFGEKMVIASASEANVLKRILAGERVGTMFVGSEKKLSSRKKWVALKKPKGSIYLDAGAVDAIGHRKKSLLATGIIAIDGSFDMGAVVELFDPAQRAVARGIVNYNSSELELIMGKNTKEIRKLLKGTYFDEVINRDDLVIY